MGAIEQVRRSIEGWEGATGDILEAWLRSPLTTEPAGRAVTAAMRLKQLLDGGRGLWLRLLGLPSRRDFERQMHLLNEIESKLLDLEERLVGEERRR